MSFKDVEKSEKCLSVGSEKELDNINDLNSVTSGENKNMSWPGDERSQDLHGRSSPFPESAGSSLPPHHPHHHKKHRKKKHGSRQRDASDGRRTPDSDRWDKDVDPLPEPQTDIPVFSVASSSSEPKSRYSSSLSQENTLNSSSQADPYSVEFMSSVKPFKRKSSSRDKKKKKHLSRQDTNTSVMSGLSEFSAKPPPQSVELYNIDPQSLMASSFKQPAQSVVITKPDASGDGVIKMPKTFSLAGSAAKSFSIGENEEKIAIRMRNESTSSAHSLTRAVRSEDENASELDDSFRATMGVAPEEHIHLAQSRQLGSSKQTYTQMSKRATSKFIVENILQRDCCKFASDSKEIGREKCICGRTKAWHEQRNLPIDEEKHVWHQKTHTLTEPCDSFGEIQFRGFGTNVANSPYARVDYLTKPNIVWELMINYWKMPRPRLLISVTGGAQRFELKPRLASLLKQGLVAAAVNTGAWFITGGTATGVMEFVGEAVRDHLTVTGKGSSDQCVALGIATWGSVANKLALDGEGENGLWPAMYAIEDVINPPKGFSSLDPNHSHFLLVDNGQEGTFGAEIAFRSELESYISAVGTTGVSENQVIATPAVLIVVEGGVNTMETVYQSLKRNTPVVVINGSGRAADFISLAYKISSNPADPDKNKFPLDFENTLKLAAERIFVWKAHDTNKDRKIQHCIDHLKIALSRKRNLINVFNLESSDSAKDIDRAILYALLKANKFNCKSQLALALAWNRCDIARQQIFTPENRSKWEIKDLYDAMFTALVQNRADFVQLFLDNGVDLKKFLTVKTLWNLYCNCLGVEDDGEASILRHIITYLKQGWGAYIRCQALEEWNDLPNYDILHFINKVIVHLLKDESFNFYPKERKFFVHDETPSMEWKGDRTTIQPLLSRISSQSKGELTGQTRSTMSIGQIYASVDSSAADCEKDGEAPGGHMSASRRIKQRLKMKENFDFDHPERDLFIFALLFNRRKMAQLFLRQGSNHIGSALLGCAILKALSDQADMDEETSISIDLMEHSQILERFAKSVLDECYLRSKVDAHRALVRKISSLGDITPILLADRQGLMEFADHSACQTKLTMIWKGCLTLHTSELKVFLTILCPFLIFLMKFHHSANKKAFGKGGEEYEEEDPQLSIQPNQVDTKADTPRFMPSKNVPEDKTKKTRFKEVRVLTCDGSKGLSIFRAYYKFYKAPVTKFYSNIIAYMVFLALFSYFLLTNVRPAGQPDSPSVIEYVVWVWFLTMSFEEVRQVMIGDQRSFRYKLRNWWSNPWNQFDFIMYAGVLISIILRYRLDEEHFRWVRIVYSITLAMSFMRLLQYFFAEKNMGPKVLMIRRMLTDLMFFFFILLVFVLSFGVAYHVNMFPNAPISWSILYNVLYYPYFQIYGELFLEDLKADDSTGCTKNETIWREDPMKRCPEDNAIVFIMLALYMILTNILLVNLLIAMFSYTFQMVQDNSTQLWKFYRISLVYEYFDRPSLVPPAIVLNHIFRAVRYILHLKINIPKRHNAFAKDLRDEDNLRVTLFEREAMEAYLAHTSVRERDQLDKKVATTADRLEMVMDDLQRIKEAVQIQEAGGKPAEETDEANQDLSLPLESPLTTGRRQTAVTGEDSTLLTTQLKELQHQTSQNSLKLAEVTAGLTEVTSLLNRVLEAQGEEQ